MHYYRVTLHGKGDMAKNYVHVKLSMNDYSIYYWKPERGVEIDLVIQCDVQLMPIEVKSADNTKAKNLKGYMDTYMPAYTIMFSAKNFGFEDGKMTDPLYSAFLSKYHIGKATLTGNGGRFYFPKVSVKTNSNLL